MTQKLWDIYIGGSPPVSGCDDFTGMLIAQDCEGAGTPSGWTDNAGSGGSINWDDTTSTILRGTQQLKIYGSSSAATESTTTVDLGTGQGTVWLFFEWKADDATPTEDQRLIRFQTVGGGSIMTFVFRTGSVFRLWNTAAGTLGTTTNTFDPVSNKYFIWLKLIKGTGANAQWAFYIGTTKTRPASPELSGTTGDMVDDVRFIQFSARATNTQFYDHIRVDDAEIVDVCD